MTVNLDDDALKYVDQFTEGRPMSRGSAISELIRRGALRPAPTQMINGFRVFSGSNRATRVNAQRVRDLDSEQDLDKVR